MNAKSRQNFLAVALVGAVIALSETRVAAQDQSVLDQVDECDSLAAHPGDPERLAEGVADDAIVPRLAITACEAALKRAPDEARFSFQLGRAYNAVRRRADAVAQFKKAADQGYGAAFAYLGDAYQFGYGVEVSVEKALEAYRKATAKGFSQADGQIEMLTFDPGVFVLDIPHRLYAGALDGLRGSESALQAYLFSFALAVGGECVSFLKPAAVLNLYKQRYPESWTSDEPPIVTSTGAVAEYDAKTFLRRHGCEGPVATRLKDNLNRLYLGP